MHVRTDVCVPIELPQLMRVDGYNEIKTSVYIYI